MRSKNNLIHTLILFGFVCLLASFSVCGAYAATDKDSVFTIDNVTVDVSADNAASAREKAFQEAQRKAFARLADRLLTTGESGRFEIPENEIIAGLVKDFEITEERLSQVRYIGTYTFRFQNEAVRNFLALRGLSYTDVGSKPVLILPYYQWGAQTVLWNNNNPWLAAWRNIGSFRGLVPVVVPLGDIQDVTDIGDNEALTYNPKNLKDMVARYDAGEAIILLAVPRWQDRNDAAAGNPPAELTVVMYRTDRRVPERAQEFTVRQSDTKSGQTVFETATTRTRKILREDWKKRTIVNAREGNRLQVRVRFDSMREWLETQQALRTVQGINDINVTALSSREATVGLQFKGSESRLRLALNQADMTLTTPRVNFADLYGSAQGSGRGSSPGSGSSSPLVYDLYLNKYGP